MGEKKRFRWSYVEWELLYLMEEGQKIHQSITYLINCNMFGFHLKYHTYVNDNQ